MSFTRNHLFGQDYACLFAAHRGGHFPAQEGMFLNRRVSGSNVTDLEARRQPDALPSLNEGCLKDCRERTPFQTPLISSVAGRV